MGDIPIRPANRPSRPSPRKTAPSSISSSAVWLMASAVLEDLESPVEALGRAHGDHEVARGQREVRQRAGVHLARPHHGDHRDARAAAQGRLAERAPVVGRAGGDGQATGADAGEVAVLLAELRDELRCAEQVGQRPGLVGRQGQLGQRRVGVVGLGDDQRELAVAVRRRPRCDARRAGRSPCAPRSPGAASPRCSRLHRNPAIPAHRVPTRGSATGPGAATRSRGSGPSPSCVLRHAPAPRPPRRSPRAGTTRRAPPSAAPGPRSRPPGAS